MHEGHQTMKCCRFMTSMSFRPCVLHGFVEQTGEQQNNRIWDTSFCVGVADEIEENIAAAEVKSGGRAPGESTIIIL